MSLENQNVKGDNCKYPKQLCQMKGGYLIFAKLRRDDALAKGSSSLLKRTVRPLKPPTLMKILGKLIALSTFFCSVLSFATDANHIAG